MLIPEQGFMPATEKRIIAVTGHYGSGKTEFSVSLATLAAQHGFFGYRKGAIADLDYVNPYFRSREQRAMLEGMGLGVYGSSYRSEVTAEIVDFDAAVRAPLDDKDCFLVMDMGGNDVGARIIHQLKDYFRRGEHLLLAVVNANRYETQTPEDAAAHVLSIQKETGLPVDGIVNNTHMLTYTTASDVLKGHRVCAAVSEMLSIPLWCDCYPEKLVAREDIAGECRHMMPIGMYMRPTWLDK